MADGASGAGVVTGGGYTRPAPAPGVSWAVPGDTPWGPSRVGVMALRGGANRDVAEAAKLYNQLHAELEWARKLLWKTLDARDEQEGRQPAVHGTPAGVRRHSRRQEPACPACLEGRAWANKRKGWR